jgi:hypothetical protein
MPPDLLRPGYEPEGYLAFLGRLSPEKGAEAAIRIARQAKMPLRISAKYRAMDLVISENRLSRSSTSMSVSSAS